MKSAQRLFRRFEGSGESSWIRLGLAVAALSAYILAFIPPFTPEEYRIVELAATPVVVFAWLFGFWGGTAAAISMIPFNAFLLSVVTEAPFRMVMSQLRDEELLPAILLLVLGAVLGGLRDVADQMRRESLLRAEMEEAHRASEERYRFVVEMVSDGILTLDDDRMILSANRAAERIFGSNVTALVGQPFRLLIPERVRDDHDAALHQYLDALVAGPCDSPLRIAGVGKDEHELALEVSFRTQLTEGRRAFTGVVRDVTERQQIGPESEAGWECAILNIEDERSGQTTADGILGGRPGMAILTARRGQEGLELARERLPDLILVDVNLPDMHGSELMRQIREDSLISRTPVILFGADIHDDQVAQLLDAGAQAFIPKPLAIEDLLRTVEEVLEI